MNCATCGYWAGTPADLVDGHHMMCPKRPGATVDDFVTLDLQQALRIEHADDKEDEVEQADH